MHNSMVNLGYLALVLVSFFVRVNTAGVSFNGEISNVSVSPSPSPSLQPQFSSLPASPHVGVRYGKNGNNLPDSSDVVALYKQNNIQKMILYGPDPDLLQALSGSNIEVVICVPNEDLPSIAANTANADSWVQKNVGKYADVKFRFISVGDGLGPEQLLNQSILQAMRNIHDAVLAAGLGIKVSTSIDTRVLGTSFPPSAGSFGEEYKQVLNPVISFLKNISAPLIIQLYPYFTFASNSGSVSLDYALFEASSVLVTDSSLQYRNLFDAMVDATFAAIDKSGVGPLEVVVETGWPSAGGTGASIDNARTYIFNLIEHVKGGTPMKPGKPIETYIFSIFDENNMASELEKHWGLFLPNKQPKYFPVGTPLFQPGSVVTDPKFAPKGRKKWRGILVGASIGAFTVIFGLGFLILFFCRRQKKNELDVIVNNMSLNDEFGNNSGPREFSYDELAKATKKFADEEKLGEGGFGAVYKGFLRDSKTNVAVKRVSKRSKQGVKEYTAEVKIISRLRHKNLVNLVGWCHKKELLLVYEFMPNGSLDFHLFKGRSLLPWKLRYKIAQDLAAAMSYLHEEGDFCVLHRDIKTSNIMLDSAFNAKLGDFGLARLVDHERGLKTTQLAGTMGYMAPECRTTGKVSKETDVYSFGVVALEIACGRRSIEPQYDEEQASLVAWVREAYTNRRILDVADKNLGTDFDINEMQCLIIVGLWCVHPVSSMRPSIVQAMQVLKFEAPFPALPGNMLLPKHDIPSTSVIETSEPCLSNMSITLPR